jgi:signal transduction histidine kinase
MVTLSLHAKPHPRTAAAPVYEHQETRELVALVAEAANLVHATGESAFDEFRVPGSRWRRGESYIFVLDPEGNMLVHPDAVLEGTNQLALKDIEGRPIIRGLLDAVTSLPGKTEGWYHYQWPVPGELLPRWKSSFVRLVQAPSGRRCVVGSGVYNDRMERAFVVDAVRDAVGLIEARGTGAFPMFHDPKGPFLAKDGYVFVLDMTGVELVNPAFPSLEGRNLLGVKDPRGKFLIGEMIEVARDAGSGWVDYMWPKPGESVSTQKSAYVSAAALEGEPVVVGCGVYLADAPQEARPVPTLTAPELMTLVREAAALLEEEGERAFAEFRRKGTRWFRDDTYFFVWTMEGTRVLHAAEPDTEGLDTSGMKDARGRPVGRMILEAGTAPSGEGWVHYMHPEPGGIFPVWKSAFVKRVTFPSGQEHIVGSGVYNMQMDAAFIEDVVERAAALIAVRGKAAFGQLRDRAGPFVFMDTYVFVDAADGTELVNPAQPGLEGRNLMELRDLRGMAVVRDEIAAALKDGSAWLECYWYRPGDNTPARKLTYVRRVSAGGETFVVGSGIYQD